MRVDKLECIGNEFYYSAAATGGSSSLSSSVGGGGGGGGGDKNHRATVAFPSLKKLILVQNDSLKEWVVPVPAPQASTTSTDYCFPLLEEITIRWCLFLTTITPTTTIFPSLKVLYLHCMDGSGGVVETLVTNNLNSLTSLRLNCIPNLITLPVQGLMENNNTLLSLVIERCSQFEGFFPPNKEEEGQEGGCKISSSCSSSLQSLKLYRCPALRFYPNILRSLTSLRSLEIQECKESSSLQEELTCLSSSSSSSLEHQEHVKLWKNKTATEEEEEEEVVFEWRKSNTFK